jgi:WhiB family transcriptional regulator, redox-sensing transcriptional regulator
VSLVDDLYDDLCDDSDDSSDDDSDGDLYGAVLRLRPYPDWSRAACKSESGGLTELFFSPDLADIAQAKAICSHCPLKQDCLAVALARKEPWGVWGGELLVDGSIIRNKRPRGRPRKIDSSQVHLRVLS